MRRRNVMRPQEFIARVDQMFATAKDLLTRDGVLLQAIALFDCHARQRMVVNEGDTPLSQQPERVRALIREFHACAAISISEAWLAWLTRSGDPQVDSLAPADRPDREEVMVVSGTWPTMGITHTRVATVLRPAEDTVDLVELDIDGALTAAGLPADGLLSSSSWLTPLLPEY